MQKAQNKPTKISARYKLISPADVTVALPTAQCVTERDFPSRVDQTGKTIRHMQNMLHSRLAPRLRRQRYFLQLDLDLYESWQFARRL